MKLNNKGEIMNSIKLIQGDCLEKMKDIEDNSIDCILIDPPYINMVDEKWDKMDKKEAKLFFKTLIEECYRILRYGGRFISFSSNDTLEYLYNDKILHRELLVVSKDVKKVSGGRNTKQYKQHINCCEYCFVGTKFAGGYTKQLLLANQGSLSSKYINEKLGVKSNGGGMWSIYSGNNICQQVPTKDKWNKFKSIFDNLPDYETFEEVFNNDLGLSNILSNYSFNIKNRLHVCQKPIELLEYLILRYTVKNSIILDCFSGSCSTGIACINTNRNFIGIEKDEKYFNIGVNRVKENITENYTLEVVADEIK